VFVVTPDDITPNFPDPVTFRVKATSDLDTTITYTWYHYDEDSTCEDKWCIVYNVPDKTNITYDNGSSLTIVKTEGSDLGLYRCIASNGISQAVFEMKLLEPPNFGLYARYMSLKCLRIN